MQIKVYATLRDVVGGPSVQLDGVSAITVNELLETLCARYPEIGPKLRPNGHDLHSALHVLINGRDMRYLNGLDTVATDRDEVRIFPPVGGGLG